MKTDGENDKVVMIVDDEPDVADAYAAQLQREYQIRTAYSGEQALELIDESVDVVLLDRRMPDMSGDEVLKELRNRGINSQVIMVTAVEPEFNIIELEFDAYLEKPVSREDLIRAIEQTLQRASFDDEVRELFALTEKQATLESQMSETELQSNDRYLRLEEWIAELNEKVGQRLESFDQADFVAAVQRTQSLAAIRESEERFQSLAEDVLDTARFGTIALDQDLNIVWANARIEEYFGYPREDLLGRDYLSVIDDIDDDFFVDEDTTDRIREACQTNDDIRSFECQIRGSGNGETTWLEHWSKPIETGLYAGGRLEHYYDITDRKRRATTLETFHEATRRMLQFETSDEIGQVLVETARDQLGFNEVAYFGWDDVDGLLRPVSATASFTDRSGELGPLSGGSGPIWRAFVDEESHRGAMESETGPLHAFTGGFVLPLGRHGVLIVGLPNATDISEVDTEFLQLLATNAEAALDRAKREQELRQRDRELANRNEQLQRLNRINTVIREIDQGLVSATSRNEINEAVCESLVQVDTYSLVWISDLDPVTGELVPRTWAGDERGFLDSVRFTEDEGPAGTAVSTREQQVIDDILESSAFDTWRREALDRGYRSLVSTPITFDQTAHGVIEVYGTRPNAFNDKEQNVLEELGRTIGHAISALQVQEALTAESKIEVELELRSESEPFSRLAMEVCKEVELRSVLPQDEGSYLVFFAVEDVAPDTVLAAVSSVSGLSSPAHIKKQESNHEFKVRLDRTDLVPKITRHGGTLHRIRAEDQTTTVMIRLPQSTKVRSFVTTISETYQDVELLARRDRPSDIPDTHSLYDRIHHRLTDRQREVLRVAYFAGYFEWPRTTDGNEVADLLDIAQPTFSEHFRTGLKNLLEELYEN